VWHTIEVTQTGDRIKCVLDGRATVEATDGTIAASGGVGLWTKADAQTSFVVPAAWTAVAIHGQMEGGPPPGMPRHHSTK